MLNVRKNLLGFRDFSLKKSSKEKPGKEEVSKQA